MNVKSVMIVGVGGQGTLLASRVLGSVLVEKGYDVKLSEVHGMSQRGGSVVTYVRYGDKVYSPIVDGGEADLILSFEPLEAARYIDRLNPTGTIITNTGKTYPMPVITGTATYPEDITGKLAEKVNTIALDATKIAAEAGSNKAVNVVLLGVLSTLMPEIEHDRWISAIEKTVKPQFVEMNKRAFQLGIEAGKK